MRTLDRNGVPVQQSMTMRPEDYVGLNLSRLMLGVVTEVFPADHLRNRSSASRADGRGYLHTCNVLIIQDGRGTHMPLENVIITPDAPTGLDDYYERLPRGCSALVTGENWNSQLNHINPYDLDGDWCIVGFMGGSVDQPFIVRWWPHPHNPFDPATSGRANPSSPSEETTLVQGGRAFHRINGVEFTVTKLGHIYVSTYRANSSLRFGDDLSPVDGRFPRTLSDSEGGSFRMWVKPSQSFELDWNVPDDGMGVMDVADEEIPQTNPSESGSSSREEKENTYILIEKDRIDITVPDQFKVLSKKRILLESQEETTLTVGGDLSVSVDGDLSTTVEGSSHTDVIGDITIGADGNVLISSSAEIDIEGEVKVTLSAPTVSTSGTSYVSIGAPLVEITSAPTPGDPSAVGSVFVSTNGVTISSGSPGSNIVSGPTGVQIGDGTLGGVVGGQALQDILSAFAADVQTAQASATVESAYAQLLTLAALKLAAAIPDTASLTTKVG